MQSWQNASSSELVFGQAVARVFRNHPNLLDFLFEPERPRLRCAPEDMLRQIRGLSSSEQILIRIALDIWSGSGNAKLWQIMETLDDGNFANVLDALAFARFGSRAI